MDDNLTKFFDAREDINAISDALAGLSDSFYHIGNEVMGNLLYKFSEELKTSTQTMTVDYESELTGRFNDAQKATHNMMAGVFAGVEIGKE